MSSRLGGGRVVRAEVEVGVVATEDALDFKPRNRGNSDCDFKSWQPDSEENDALLPSRFKRLRSIVFV